MSAEANKALIQRYFEAISGKDKPASVVDQFVSDEDKALKQHVIDAERGFPRYELLADDLVAEGDKVMVKVRLRATHNGDFMGISATGRQVEVAGALSYTIANGKIVDHWMLLDNMALLQQLGVIPTPSAAS